MKHLHSFPVDCWKSRERFEELKLGSASRCDQPCLSLLLNGVAQNKRGLVRCNPRHLFLIVEALDHHFGYSPDQGSMRIPRRSPYPSIARAIFLILCSGPKEKPMDSEAKKVEE